MAATLLAVNERAHVDLSDDDIGAEPAILGATDCSFFTGPGGEFFTVATSIVGSRTFPSWLRAMRRADLLDDPRFSSAAARRLNFGALHQIIQSWIMTFQDMATLDAQFDEAKIAMGEIRSLKELAASSWSDYWGAVQQVSDRNGGEYRLPGRPWHFSAEELTPIGSPAFQGEHNFEVFGELGIPEAELKRLSDAGVLVTHPRAKDAQAAVKPPSEPGQAA
jgi:crotonobetainyl-CoA:carnitine CoA-transferase CaiB-like acyl-CoA transferase